VLRIIGIGNEYPSLADLAAFMRRYRSNGADATYAVEQVNGGGYDPNHPSAEANVDIQYTTAMAYPTPLVFYSTGRRGPEGATDYLISWFRFILDQPNVPQTISMSYSVFEKFVPSQYATFVCNLFGILGLRGVSALFASGDDGVGRGDCVTQYGYVQFTPRFPAICTCSVFLGLGGASAGHSPQRHAFAGPWVTAVSGLTGRTPEVAANLSGGGFSNIFQFPNYQIDAVPPFLGKPDDNVSKQVQVHLLP
jgi:tripeptidyl-peptidase-1